MAGSEGRGGGLGGPVSCMCQWGWLVAGSCVVVGVCSVCVSVVVGVCSVCVASAECAECAECVLEMVCGIDCSVWDGGEC